jgi:hypothetical protein
MKTKKIKQKTFTDLSTFDPMLKDPIPQRFIVRDIQFRGKSHKSADEIKSIINKDYNG